MNLKVIVLAAAAALSAATLPGTARAGCRGCGTGAAVVGGLALGANVAAPPPPRRAYVEEYVEGPVCHVERQRFWDGYGWRHRRVEVCD